MNDLSESTPFITSKENDFFKLVKSYTLSKNRKREGVVFVEGTKSFKEASECLRLRYALINEDFDSDSLDEETLSHLTRLSNHLFKALSDTKSSQGIIGIFELSEFELELSSQNKIVVLEGIQDPGNVGTIVRTALFLGYEAVLLDEACAACFSPKVIRSSMGAVFHIPCITAPLKEHLGNLKEAGFCIIGGDLQGETLQRSEDLPSQQRIALLFGSEGQGLSDAALACCDHRYKIPAASPAAESLNVAVASGIMMFQLNPLDT